MTQCQLLRGSLLADRAFFNFGGEWGISSSVFLLPGSPRLQSICSLEDSIHHHKDIFFLVWLLFLTFIYLWLGLRCWAWAFSSSGVWASQRSGLSLRRAQAHKSFSSCGTGLAAPQHVGSSQTRDRTCVPCISRHILNCWTTREIQGQHFKLQWEAKSMSTDPGLEAIWGLG